MGANIESPRKFASEVQSEFEESKEIEEKMEVSTQKYYKFNPTNNNNYNAGDGERNETMTARTIESTMFEGLSKPKVDLIKIYTKGESAHMKNSLSKSHNKRLANEDEINIFSDPFGVNQNISIANFEDFQGRRSEYGQFENIMIISDLPT